MSTNFTDSRRFKMRHVSLPRNIKGRIKTSPALKSNSTSRSPTRKNKYYNNESEEEGPRFMKIPVAPGKISIYSSTI